MLKSFMLLFVLAAPAFAAPVIETINGRQLESLTLRHATSQDVVVMEGGSRGTIDKWGEVPERLAADASVFVYNRPGYGNSEAAVTPRDGRTIVEELRGALRVKGLRPPYVLVGHSLGGLYMQLFARTYPEEVKALVLIDSLYPGMVKKAQDFPWTTRLAGQLAFSRPVWREIEQIDDTGEMVLKLPGIDDKPVVRLINQPQSSTAIAVDFGAFRMDEATRAAVKALYPKAKTVVVDSSHQMPLTSPDVVVAAIQPFICGAAR
ncbi:MULTISPECIES: alpha/beta fold hydrolase [unclassified Duganella]|uniref:alpha/beta fold hydrolase n=1 Tax=unclassified Duganella TaxID=2636909 RepID=UPI000880DCEB|nr:MULTISPECIES: alpha/beta hydrolase [unclassified Duganella]SDG96389.1 alpha/beta hydrolase fold [Duganella sp. OV458]SDJ45956.1 alpha/beta hydrolase fold [Duganella sp. OV510]